MFCWTGLHISLYIVCSRLPFSASEVNKFVVAMGEASLRRGRGRSKNARETIGFSTRFRIATWKCAAFALGMRHSYRHSYTDVSPGNVQGKIDESVTATYQRCYKELQAGRWGPRTDSGRRDASKRQALELSRPHPPPGRAPGNTKSTNKLRQANPGHTLRLWSRPR